MSNSTLTLSKPGVARSGGANNVTTQATTGLQFGAASNLADLPKVALSPTRGARLLDRIARYQPVRP